MSVTTEGELWTFAAGELRKSGLPQELVARVLAVLEPHAEVLYDEASDEASLYVFVGEDSGLLVIDETELRNGPYSRISVTRPMLRAWLILGGADITQASEVADAMLAQNQLTRPG